MLALMRHVNRRLAMLQSEGVTSGIKIQFDRGGEIDAFLKTCRHDPEYMDVEIKLHGDIIRHVASFVLGMMSPAWKRFYDLNKNTTPIGTKVSIVLDDFDAGLFDDILNIWYGDPVELQIEAVFYMLAQMSVYNISPSMEKSLIDSVKQHTDVRGCARFFTEVSIGAVSPLHAFIESYFLANFNEVMDLFHSVEFTGGGVELPVKWKTFAIDNKKFIESGDRALTLQYLKEIDRNVDTFVGFDIGIPWGTIDLKPRRFSFDWDRVASQVRATEINSEPVRNILVDIQSVLMASAVFDASSLILVCDCGYNVFVFDTVRCAVTKSRFIREVERFNNCPVYVVMVKNDEIYLGLGTREGRSSGIRLFLKSDDDFIQNQIDFVEVDIIDSALMEYSNNMLVCVNRQVISLFRRDDIDAKYAILNTIQMTYWTDSIGLYNNFFVVTCEYGMYKYDTNGDLISSYTPRDVKVGTLCTREGSGLYFTQSRSENALCTVDVDSFEIKPLESNIDTLGSVNTDRVFESAVLSGSAVVLCSCLGNLSELDVFDIRSSSLIRKSSSVLSPGVEKAISVAGGICFFYDSRKNIMDIMRNKFG